MQTVQAVIALLFDGTGKDPYGVEWIVVVGGAVGIFFLLTATFVSVDFLDRRKLRRVREERECQLAAAEGERRRKVGCLREVALKLSLLSPGEYHSRSGAMFKIWRNEGELLVTSQFDHGWFNVIIASPNGDRIGVPVGCEHDVFVGGYFRRFVEHFATLPTLWNGRQVA